MRVKAKVAVITGGAGGIGAATARALTREGARIVITDVGEEAGRAIAREVDGEFFRHDVSDEQQWQKIVDQVIASHGRIDVLVNAAGILGDIEKSGLATSLAEWRRVMSINLDGTFLGCRTCMPKMLERGSGSIVNISSIITGFATPTAVAYGASKAAVEQLSRSMAQLGGREGKRVRCNSVHPGLIKTRMTDDFISEASRLSNVTPEQTEEAVLAGILFGASGQPVDVANLIVFLASDDSSYITGSAFQVDGGWHIVNAG